MKTNRKEAALYIKMFHLWSKFRNQAHILIHPNGSSLSTHRAANYKLYDTF